MVERTARSVGRRLAAGLVAGSLLVAGLGTTGRLRFRGTRILPSSVTGTPQRSRRSSSMPGRRTPRRSCGSGSSRPRSTTRSSGSPGNTSCTSGTSAARGRRRRKPPLRRPRHVAPALLPRIEGRLDTQLAASLSGVDGGPAKEQGIAYGEAAADHIIALRVNDGRNAAITFDQAPAPGVWRPTPPANAPFFAPWLGQVSRC